MKKTFFEDRRGVSRLIVLLIVLVAAMLVVVGIPLFIHFKGNTDERGCSIAIESAQRKLDTEYLTDSGMTYDEAAEAATSGVRDLDDICPAGGHVYVVETSNSSKYKLVCGIHDADSKERTRLNADYAKELLNEAVRSARRAGTGRRATIP